MEDHGNRLSGEMLDLCSSFDSTLECNMSLKQIQVTLPSVSFEKTVSTYSDLSTSNTHFKELKSCSELYSTDFNSTEGSLSHIIRAIDHSDNNLHSSSKLKEFKSLLSEVNDGYKLWMTSQFFLDSYKVSEFKIPSQLADKVKEIITTSSIPKHACGSSRSGETFNLFGLDSKDIETARHKSLSSLEQMELNKHAVTYLRSNITQLSEQKKAIKDVFGSHCIKVVPTDSLLTEEQLYLLEQYQEISQQLEKAQRLLVCSNQIMQQLSHLVKNSMHSLQSTTYTCLLNKAKYLHNTTSIFKLRLEKMLHKDKNQTRAMTQLGITLRTSTDDLSETLKGLQKTLDKYERTVESSKQFRETVLEFAKIKRQLQHKQQTLAVLNDPDISFS